MASSSSSSHIWIYDVFPSFSGEDIRDNFLSHFRKELDRKSIISFKDNEIQKGQSLDPELKKAIMYSRIAVVLFSENYASSRWCLNELLEIVKCKEEFGQLVIPIFLRLDPSHVRKQTGYFGNIFNKTCKNVTKEVMNQWRKALTDVANIVGYHSQKCHSEATLIGEIIQDILGRLNLNPPKDFPEDFVGIEDHIAKMTSLLCMGSEDVRTVGIWGPSGIGKSTIARVLFNRLSRDFQFDGRIYIDNAFISSTMQGYMKSYLRGELMFLIKRVFCLLAYEDDVTVKQAFDWGCEMFKHRKLLIFFDDLDNKYVLDALDLGQDYWIGKGSRIIIISKDRHLLDAHGVDCTYEIGLPSEQVAIEMLCQSAFRRSSPPEGFEELVVEVARHAGSLPLGLDVLGKSLRGRGTAYWAKMLPRLEKGIDGSIERTLRVSYDGLGSEEDKEIFRHIACLFNLEKVKDIELLLADSELGITVGLNNLAAKSLIHVRLNIVEMHTLIQKMGKEVVRNQSENPGKREFLVDSKDICHVLEEKTGTPRVLGIRLNMDKIDELRIHEKAFKKMSNLQFLTIFSNKDGLEKKVKVHLPYGFNYLPPKLKLLCWDGYPMKSMPSNFPPKSLIMLKMKNSKLRKLWEGACLLPYLKEVNLWGSEKLKEFPDVSRATSLEKLYLGYCLSWVQPPSSIQKLNDSTMSRMLECRNLETLPTGINLESPKSLVLREGSHLSLGNLPEETKTLTNMVRMLPDSLKVLFLSDIPNMVELPFSIQNLNKLTDLIITRCTNLETLPTGMNLESLERLNLNGCSRLRTFPDISRNVSSLYLEETSIEQVPWWVETFSELQYLIMQRCSKLEYANLNISKMKLLEWVNFSHCGALTGVGWNGYPNSLENIGTESPVSMEASTSRPNNIVPKAEFSLSNCPNLDQEALFQQLPFEKLISSGEELPLHFTHQTTGPSMAFPLLHSPPVFRFRACTVVVFNSEPTYGATGVRIEVICRFKSRFGGHFDSHCREQYFSVYHKGSHLLSLDCHIPLEKDGTSQAEVSYDYVDIQLHMSSGNSKFKLKEWGIRLLEDYSSTESRLGNPNTLPQIGEANEDNTVNDGCHETEQGEKCQESLRNNGRQEGECGDNNDDSGYDYEAAIDEEECGDNTISY